MYRIFISVILLLHFSKTLLGEDQTHKIALCIPTYFSLNTLQKNIKTIAVSAQDYFKGAVIAADSLSKCHHKIEMSILETNNLMANQFIISDSLRKWKPDWVISPFTTSDIKIIEYITQNLNLKLYSGIGLLDSCSKSGFYLQSNPPVSEYGLFAAKYIDSVFPDSRILIISHKTAQKDAIASSFLSHSSSDSIKIIDMKGKTIIKKNLLEEVSPAKNVLFLTTKSEEFASTLLSNLQADSSEGGIVVVGIYPLLNFKSIGFDLWSKFKLHIITPYFVNYQLESVKDFIKQYRAKYNEEPTEMSFRGYDDLLTSFYYYGQNNLSTPMKSFQSLHTIFNPQEINCSNHYYNKTLFMLKYEENEFIRIK